MSTTEVVGSIHPRESLFVPSNITISDLEELENVYKNVKNAELKKKLGCDLRIWRSKLVTKLINEKVDVPKRKRNNKNENTEGIVDLPPEHPTKKDEDEYWEKNIRGYKQKLNSIVEIFPDLPLEKIKEALICCKGKEDQALDALLCENIPERPKLPQEFLNEWKKNRDKALQKIKLNENTVRPSSAQVKSEEYIPDVAPNDELMLKKRLDILQKEVEKKKKKINELKSKVGVASNLIDPVENNENNKLYLPGEYEAIQNSEVRTFTFKPERTFSNEVSHIHYRVAESEFYRLLSQRNCYKVTEVKYIVSPPVLEKFERKRAAIAFEMGKEFKEVKPALTFYASKDSLEWITYNSFTPSESGYYCSNDPSYVTGHMSGQKFIVLSLCLTGTPQLHNDLKYEKQVKPRFHSLVSSNGLNIKVFDLDQLLPYYIVYFESPLTNANAHLQPKVKLLDEEWKTIETEAKADKFVNDCQQFYQETLLKKDKEKKLGELNPTDEWFEKEYKKRLEREKKLIGDDDLVVNETYDIEIDEESQVTDPSTPITPLSSLTSQSLGGGDSQLPTPSSVNAYDFDAVLSKEEVKETQKMAPPSPQAPKE